MQGNGETIPEVDEDGEMGEDDMENYEMEEEQQEEPEH
jgi:hypothetical protein